MKCVLILYHFAGKDFLGPDELTVGQAMVIGFHFTHLIVIGVSPPMALFHLEGSHKITVGDHPVGIQIAEVEFPPVLVAVALGRDAGDGG